MVPARPPVPGEPVMVGDLEVIGANGYGYIEEPERDTGPLAVALRFCTAQGMQCFTLAVFFYEGAAYNAIFLGRVLPAEGRGDLVVPFLVLFNLVWGMSMWSYFQAHSSDPGCIPKRWQEFVLRVGENLPIAPARMEWQPGKATFCTRCRVPRPERAHHCNICDMCVLRMDHHCPWINNCVGFKNYKFFLLLGTYACLTSYVALLTSLPELLHCLGYVLQLQAYTLHFHLLPPQMGVAWEGRELQTSDVCVFLIFGALAVIFAMLLTPMVLTHWPLAFRNLTTIESNYINMPNPFDQGGGRENLAQVFGTYGLDWFFPVAPLRPLTDGISFTRADERLGPDGMPDLPESLMDHEESDAELLWRFRYHVRGAPAGPSFGGAGGGGLVEEDVGPLTTISRWLRGQPLRPGGPRRIISL